MPSLDLRLFLSVNSIFSATIGKPHRKTSLYLEVGTITTVTLSCTCSWYIAQVQVSHNNLHVLKSQESSNRVKPSVAVYVNQTSGVCVLVRECLNSMNQKHWARFQCHYHRRHRPVSSIGEILSDHVGGGLLAQPEFLLAARRRKRNKGYNIHRITFYRTGLKHFMMSSSTGRCFQLVFVCVPHSKTQTLL